MPSTGSFKKRPRRTWGCLTKSGIMIKMIKYGEGPAFMLEESRMWFDLLTENVEGMFMIALKMI